MQAQPERSVENNLLVSSAMPAIKVKIAGEFNLLGRLDFILYGVAGVELFVFVAASDHAANRFLIVQFERYLDTNSHTYSYPVTHLVTIGSKQYVHDTFVVPTSDDLSNPESDGARTLKFIREQGYTLSQEVVTSRFVHLLDESRRSELLFSYNENLGNLGYKAADIAEDFRPRPEYSSLADDQLHKALRAFEVIED